MHQRKKLFVDPKVQGALLVRAVGYWFCCLIVLGLGLLSWNLLTGPDQPLIDFFLGAWHWFVPAAIASVVLLPIVVYDSLKFSNRFAGPLFRLRREMRRLAAGEKVEPLHFRDDDFWPEFASEFNAIIRRVEALTPQTEPAVKASGKGDRPVAKENPYLAPLAVGGPETSHIRPGFEEENEDKNGFRDLARPGW